MAADAGALPDAAVDGAALPWVVDGAVPHAASTMLSSMSTASTRTKAE
jgi:hypothetical protein